MGAGSSSEEGEPVVYDVDLHSLKGHHGKFIAAVADDEDSVLEAFEDGKLLADFSVYLVSQEMWSQLIDLWKLDTVQSLPYRDLAEAKEESKRLVTALKEAWEAYQLAPEGRGNFEDAEAWADLDMPDAGAIGGGGGGKKDSKSVDSENELYHFAVAAMVGIHVSTVCNDVLLRGLGQALKMTGVDAAEEFHKSFPKTLVDECLKRSIREFYVPMNGTAYSPKMSHVLSEDYHFEEICPQLFAGIRRLCKVSNAEYFDSMCRTDFEFISFGSNSKSGEVFFFSHDKKYLLKTTTEIEASTLMSMLVDYEAHVATMPHTFLGRYLGLYRLTMEKSSRLFFVMRAVSDPTLGIKISKSFDIKGSTRHRLAPDTDSVGKDLNFDDEVGALDLDPQIAQQIAVTHKSDCELLRQYSIMDFSFLIQINDAEGQLGVPKQPTRALSFASDSSISSDTLTDNAPGVKLKGGASRVPTWFNQNDSAFAGMELVEKFIQFQSDTAKGDMKVNWSPNKGIKSPDGRYTYFFGLIDMLVPFSLYPKAQYVGTHCVACVTGKCDAEDASRIPPDKYCDRQEAKVAFICGLEDMLEAEDI